MNKGGYKIVNFNGVALSGMAVELTGIYDQIVDDYDKPIMVSGVTLNGKLQDDAYADVQEKTAQDLSKSVELTVYGGIITVTEDDEVTYASAKSNTDLTADVANIMSKALMKQGETSLSSDINNAVTGWAYYLATSPNLPSESAYFVLTLVYSDHKCQFAISRLDGSLYTRSCSSGVWASWKLASNTQ